MPYKVTAVRHVRPDLDGRVAENVSTTYPEQQVLAASIPDVVEDLAMQTAYKLGLAAGAEHVLLTALDGQGRPNPGPNPWTCRTTVMVDEKTGGRPIRVTVDGPPGEKR